MFWLNFYQIACITRLIVTISYMKLSLYPLLFLVALEQYLILGQESLVIFYIPNEIISELNVNR